MSYASFVAPLTPRGNRVMVVRNRQNGQWMMPGGLVDRGESSSTAAGREYREETGFRPHGLMPVSKKTTRRGNVNLFATQMTPNEIQKRRETFSRRPHAHETSEYGFVDLRRPRHVVEQYDGRFKASQGFRPGSIEHLNQMRTLHRGHHNQHHHTRPVTRSRESRMGRR